MLRLRRQNIRVILTAAAYGSICLGICLILLGIVSARQETNAFDSAVLTYGGVIRTEERNRTTFYYDTPTGRLIFTRKMWRIPRQAVPWKPGDIVFINYRSDPPHDVLWMGPIRQTTLVPFESYGIVTIGTLLALLSIGLVRGPGALLKDWP